MVFPWWLRRFGGDEWWRGTQVRVEVPASWFMMIWYGSAEIPWSRGQVFLLEIQRKAHTSSKID